MVEVIFRGTPPNERTYKVECEVCNSRFTFQQQEAEPFKRIGGTFRSEQEYLKITCPVCLSNVEAHINDYEGN